MKRKIRKALKRVMVLAGEPSTYTGIAVILGGAAVWGLSETEWMMIMGAVMMVAGVPAVVSVDPADEWLLYEDDD